jgi:hypothetical protein
MIIDSHIHVPSLGEKHKDFADIKKGALESMKKNNISHSIVIPDNVFTNPDCADIDTLLKTIENDKRFFAMASFNIFTDIEAQINKFENLIIDKKICAIKLFPGHDPFYPIDKRCAPIYELCVKHDIPVVVHTGVNTGNLDCAKFNDPKYLVEIAGKYRDLKIVISHFFWPEMEYCYMLTDDIKNIYYDTSAMADPEVIDLTGGWEKVVMVLKKIVLKKPDQVMFGTDFPMCPVDKHIQMIKDLKMDCQIEEKIFSGNAINLYKLEIK